MLHKINTRLIFFSVLSGLLLQVSGFAFADGSGAQVPILALDGATATSTATQKPLYEVGGAKATLERDESAIEIEVETSGLPFGAYTNWWILFNQPASCAAAVCQFSDIGNPNTDASVLWATGVVIDRAEAEFEAELAEGEIPGQVLFGSGLTNAAEAQVMYIIKWHGPASTDPDILYEQLNNVADPNCETAPLPGLTGLGRCPDLQASGMFMP